MRFPILLSAETLTAENRWRLVSSLFVQGRSSLDSALALGGAIAVCWMRTGWSGFGWLAGLAALATVVTFRQNRAFHRFRAANVVRTAKASADYWARLFLARICLLAIAWGALDLVLFLRFDDAALQLLVTTMQAAWLAGAAARNAASPAGVVAPMTLILVPIAVGAALAGDHFVRVMIPFLPILFSAMLSITRDIGQQLITSMASEQRLAELNEQLTRLSTTDGLTGIGNRRCFDAALQVEWAGAIRDASDLALLMVDADYFKLYNDRYGHLDGDDCLRKVALCAQSVLHRPADLITRFGGEEFAVLLPSTSEAGARDVAEQLRGAVYDLGLVHLGSPLGRASVSVGVASMAPAPGSDPQALIALADQALYDAKQAGRNQVRTASERLRPGNSDICARVRVFP